MILVGKTEATGNRCFGFFADLVQRESCVPCSGEGAVPGDEKRKVVANSGEPAFERKLEQEPKTVGAARIIPYIEFRNITQKNGIITTNP